MPIPAGQTASRPRRTIGRYVVTGRIGRGGMGMVYRGLDEALEREVAVKTLTIEGTLDEESRQRFEIEAKAAARLQHPNIVTVFELGEDRGVPFIAMELLPGSDIETLLRSGEPLLLHEKLDVVVQVLRGLAFAHEHRIVHRDIKPSNIRLLDDGTAKIMDFGIAKLGGTNLTKSGMMVGTVHYMSPEQIRGKALDGRSDVFSVGVILYELLAGRRPFPGEGATEVLYKIVQEPHPPLPPLPEDPGGVTERLQAILDRALAKEPAGRFAAAAPMADELADVLGDLTRAAAAPTSPQDVEALGAARRLLKEGRAEESMRRLSELHRRNPSSVEIARSLRAARREQARRQRAPEPETQDFPELDATFLAPPTQKAGAETVVQPGTVMQPTVVKPPHAPARGPGRGALVGAVVGVVAALAAAVLLLSRREEGGAGRPAPAEVRIPVRSQPPGAAVLVDGKDSGVVTDGEIALPASREGTVVLTFRKAGYREESRTVALPFRAGDAVSVALASAAARVAVISDPSGAAVALDGQRVKGATPLDVALDPATEHRLTVSLEGHAAQEVRLAAGRVPPEVRVTLVPEGPPGSVTVLSQYPLDVLWRGKVLAKAQVSPRVSLPAGRHTLTLASGAYFLKSAVAVDVRAGGQASLEAPALGKISIRASPDNCEVFIDGAFVDYPPILDKPVAAGSHTVVFKWPDGTRREEAEVLPGKLVYVMGRKE